MGDPSNTIVLAGSGRSGTTWLANVIAADLSFRTIFEPFDARHVPEAGAAGVSLRPYCSVGEKCPELYAFTRLALAGKLRNRWVDQQGLRLRRFHKFGTLRLHQLWLPRFWSWRLVLKTVRATLLLEWIDANFHPPIVYLIRHPAAVVTSRCRLGWETHLELFLSQPKLMHDYLSRYRGTIESAKTEVQKHTIMWCVENLVPLERLSYHDWIFCTYEYLYIEPLKEICQILSRLGLKLTRRRLNAINKLSHVTRRKGELKTGEGIAAKWRETLSAKDINDIKVILREFDINLYSVDEPLPNHDVYASLQGLG